jgi:hypothetical protein
MACERLVHQADGSHHAIRIYLDPIPWRPPVVHLPLAAVFLLDGLEDGSAPVPVRIRLLCPRGTTSAEISGKVPRPDAGDRRRFPGFLEGHLAIDEPGDYELLAIVEGQPVDDGPTWRLSFRRG